MTFINYFFTYFLFSTLSICLWAITASTFVDKDSEQVREILACFSESRSLPVIHFNSVSVWRNCGLVLAMAVTYKHSPNSNATKKMDGCAEAHIIELACSAPPEGYSRWTLRLLAEKSKVILETPVSKDAIRKTFKKQNLSLTGIPTVVSRQTKMPLSQLPWKMSWVFMKLNAMFGNLQEALEKLEAAYHEL